MINNQPTGPHVREKIRKHIGWQKRKYDIYTDPRARGLRFKPYVFLPADAAHRIMRACVDELQQEGYHIESQGLSAMSGGKWTFTITVGV